MPTTYRPSAPNYGLRVLTWLLPFWLCGSAIASTANPPTDTIAQGKAIAWDRKAGNCLACHSMPEGDSPGNLGPPLIAMRARFPERQKLFDQIYDATQINPSSRMPPFGKHHILSTADINAIIDYLYTL